MTTTEIPSIKACMSPFSLDCDSLSRESSQSDVTSFSGNRLKYKVSLSDQSCTCQDFFEERSDNPRDHFSRWCKHIIHSGTKIGAFVGMNPWHQAIADEGAGGPMVAFLISGIDGQQFLTTIGTSRDWINVYVRTALTGEKLPHLSGPIKQFGWSIEGKRWSYGEPPPGARNIRKLLAQIESIAED